MASKGYYIGLMSGTSMDGIDATLVEFCNQTPKLIATHKEPIPTTLKQQIIALCTPGDNGINRMGEADVALGKLFATAALTLIKQSGIEKQHIIAIGSHGQTIRHMPTTPLPFTLQIADPNIIAANTGITTIADFRRRDMALGGQAAPLAPAFHHYLLHHPTENRCIVNIGGIANLTLLPTNNTQAIIGFDTGPGNTLMDAWISQQRQQSYDHNGEWAKSGNVNQTLLTKLLNDTYFKQLAPKSTGREYFNLQWLGPQTLPPADIQATLLALTVQSIKYAIQQLPVTIDSIWLCGGGANNAYLCEQLASTCSPIRMTTTEEAGIHPDWVEAACFAWLAKQTIEKKPGNLPSVTGASRTATLGAIYAAD